MSRDPAPVRRRAWREPMLWLVFGLPAAVVAAGFITLWLAIRSGGADAVADEVRRTAQIQTTDLGPDEVAARRGLSAVLSVQDQQVVLIAVSGEFAARRPLHLRLSHPVRAERDLHLVLQPTATGWSAPATVAPDNAWSATLQDTDAQWRITGRLQAGQRAARLAPAVAPR